MLILPDALCAFFRILGKDKMLYNRRKSPVRCDTRSLIAVVIFVGLSGLPLSGAPKAKQIASAQATFDGKTVEVSQQDMQIAADLAGGLRRWFGKTEQTMPRAYITYQLTNGTQVVIGANEHTIYENGSYYPNKGEKGKLFEQVVEGLFFGGEIPAQPQGK